MVGNHDLSVPRAVYLDRLHLPSSYYSVCLADGWRLIALDTTDLCLLSGFAEDSAEMQESRVWWRAHPLSEECPMASDWNGGVAAAQMAWLDLQLAAAEQAGERVVVMCHHPLLGCRETHKAWNWRELQQRLVGKAALVLHGHDHLGGYACVGGTHFVTPEAMLEAPRGSNAYALVGVFPDRLELQGVGRVTSRVMHLAPLLGKAEGAQQ